MLSAAPGLSTYLTSPAALIAVVLPGIASTAFLVRHAFARRLSLRLSLTWLATLPVTLACTRWICDGEVHELYIFSAFSVAVLIIFFKRMTIAPTLVYALTFLSLGLVDTAAAFGHAIDYNLPIETFYLGIGGAGVWDSLFIVPLCTAIVAAYAAARLRSTNAVITSF